MGIENLFNPDPLKLYDLDPLKKIKLLEEQVRLQREANEIEKKKLAILEQEKKEKQMEALKEELKRKAKPTCPDCNGTGTRKCNICDGSGKNKYSSLDCYCKGSGAFRCRCTGKEGPL